jgi:hypothetical protein
MERWATFAYGEISVSGTPATPLRREATATTSAKPRALAAEVSKPTPEQMAAQAYLDVSVPVASLPKMWSRKRPI